MSLAMKKYFKSPNKLYFSIAAKRYTFKINTFNLWN